MNTRLNKGEHLKQISSAVLDALPMHIAVLDAQGTIVDVNLAWKRFSIANVLGTQEFAVGSNYLEVCERVHGDCAEQAKEVANGIRRVLSGAIPDFSMEYPCHSPLEKRWFRMMVTPLNDPDGDGAVVMHFNITERRVLEEELLQKEREQRDAAANLAKKTRLLQESQEVAKVGSWYTDLSTFAVVWSDETYRIFEVTPVDFHPSHQSFLERVFPEDRSAVDKAFLDSIGQLGTFSHEHRIVMPTGSIKFVVERWCIYYDEEGRALRAVGTCQDITEKKLSEIERDRLFNHSLDMMCVADLEGRFIQVNPAWTECLGWSSEEIVGKRSHDFVVDEDLAALSAVRKEVQAGKSLRGFLNRYRCKDGSIRWLSWNTHPLVEFQKVFAVARDVTEQIKRDQNQYRAQRLESIGTLAGGIAHDLNNSLSPLIMGLDMLRPLVTNDESRRLIETMSSSAQRSAEMVRQVLLFARGVEGQRSTLSVATIIDEVRTIIADTFNKNIEIIVELPEGVWTVEGDSTQLHQVLLNLCLNARDAMPSGGRLTLRVSKLQVDVDYAEYHSGAKPGSYVRIDVEDTGTGMDQQVMERMFDPFFTTKSAGEGTGLGLSTSLAIVKGHGGFFVANSTCNAGSTLSVCLPAGADPVSVATTSTATTLHEGAGELILVVDDEPGIRTVTSQALEAHGYRVLVASTGAEAVAFHAERGPDIALTIVDMIMPRMDGVTTIRALRRLSPWARIVAVSGYSSEEQRAQCLQLDVRSFLVKPYTASLLLKTVQQSLLP